VIESPLIEERAGFIDGQWSGAESGRTLRVQNPATGEHLADVPDMGPVETNAAVASASAASTRESTLSERAEWLAGIHALLLAEKQELARIITLEQGKPLKESVAEVEYAAGFFDFAARNISEVAPRRLREPIRNLPWTVLQRPAGVVALITPWNFPLAMLAKKLAGALAAGCAIVAKPAELTPLTAIGFWHLARRAGLPPRQMNLVIGKPAPIGEVFCTHPVVRLISFTGSTEVGKLLAHQAGPHLKRLALELGGNAPFIVFDDAECSAAVEQLIANKFRCAGQTCVCANRVYVQAGIANQFIEAVSARVRGLRVGNGLDPETDIGPLINRAAVEKVSRHVQDAIDRGAKQLVGNEHASPRGASFYSPTVLTGVTAGMLLSREETFGPVVAISSFQTEKEAIELANGTPSGLAAYLFTGDPARAERMIRGLLFGHIGVNTGMGPAPEAPFGGFKESGFGREGGLEGLREFCEPQTVAGA
jgi:succinate-semialdehyde dehydrogenase/glutarate-semialdehyde dehydrogenase